ncbi:LysE family translocator [Amylibacter sp. IMCC11727]|uniref:LysE family translocator n=1 Tax=Amylibacter sp. IMCC11727 TaxID=3039851 RepID=UPI00244DB52F|nr:LysE family translocator [Amylibacter sp. IMCC11727]WGI21848.1 LysE family translocator [Amylibacter sp. IMCC11727]
MTASFLDLLFYAGAIFLLFATPGPVWVALIARALSGGFHSAWPLALGVVVGDVLWPLVAIFGVSYLVSVYADFMFVLKIIGAIMFVFMGVQLLRKPVAAMGKSDSRLTRPSMWAGFMAGLLVILSNPKAILFYMGALPSFFDFRTITVWDIAAICSISLIVPLLGNVALAAMVDRMRVFLASPEAIRRLNVVSGVLLIGVGLLIAVT